MLCKPPLQPSSEYGLCSVQGESSKLSRYVELLLLQFVSFAACLDVGSMVVARSVSRPVTRPVASGVARAANTGALIKTLASVAGLIKPEFRNDSIEVGSSVFGRHFLNDGIRGLIYDCDITHVELHALTVQPDSEVRVSVWRSNAVVALSSAMSIVAGYQQIELPSSLSAQEGDKIGLWVSPDAGMASQRFKGVTLRYGFDGDGTEVDSDGDFATALSESAISYGVQADGQYMIASVGDSIEAGGNIDASNNFNPYFENILFSQRMGGDDERAQPTWITAGNLDWGYENHAAGSQTFAWGVTDGLPAALARNPSAIRMHFGINDIDSGLTWADIEDELELMEALVPATMPVLIDEVLPYTLASSAEKTEILNVNTNLATWCASRSNWHLIELFDAMEDPGTANALNPTYDYGDTLHLNLAGVQARETTADPQIKAALGLS